MLRSGSVSISSRWKFQSVNVCVVIHSRVSVTRARRKQSVCFHPSIPAFLLQIRSFCFDSSRLFETYYESEVYILVYDCFGVYIKYNYIFIYILLLSDQYIHKFRFARKWV